MACVDAALSRSVSYSCYFRATYDFPEPCAGLLTALVYLWDQQADMMNARLKGDSDEDGMEGSDLVLFGDWLSPIETHGCDVLHYQYFGVQPSYGIQTKSCPTANMFY